MKHIAYTHREFRLCEWPNELTTHRWSPDDSDDAEYAQAVTSAMENGVRFEDQDEIKNYLVHKLRIGFRFTEMGLEAAGTFDESSAYDKEGKLRPTPSINDRDNRFRWWQPKEGENWPAPQEVIVEYQAKDEYVVGEWLTISKEVIANYKTEIRKVAVLRSESVEKKETGAEKAIKATDRREQIMQLLEKYYDKVPLELVHALDRLNQSTPKE